MKKKDRNQINIDLVEEPRFGGISSRVINEFDTVGVYALPRANKPLFLKREKYNDFRMERNQTDSVSFTNTFLWKHVVNVILIILAFAAMMKVAGSGIDNKGFVNTAILLATVSTIMVSSSLVKRSLRKVTERLFKFIIIVDTGFSQEYVDKVKKENRSTPVTVVKIDESSNRYRVLRFGVKGAMENHADVVRKIVEPVYHAHVSGADDSEMWGKKMIASELLTKLIESEYRLEEERRHNRERERVRAQQQAFDKATDNYRDIASEVDSITSEATRSTSR